MTTKTVAVAGGTGGIGKTIVEELARDGKYKVIVLSRKESTIPSLNIPIHAADYTSTSSLQSLLTAHNVNIIISALGLFSPESSEAQLALINAAIKTPTMEIFIPSEFGIKYTPELLSFHPAAQWWLDAADLLRNSRLKFTRVMLGWTLDHYGIPGYPSNMKPFRFALDFEHRRAALPGQGEEKVAFLHSSDLAKYLVALLESDNWPEWSAFAGDRMSWGEMVKLGEEITGEKWLVTHDSVEMLEKGQATVLEQPEGAPEMSEEAVAAIVSEYGIMATMGLMDVTTEGVRNNEFPEIKPVSVREVVEAAWGKKSS